MWKKSCVTQALLFDRWSSGNIVWRQFWKLPLLPRSQEVLLLLSFTASGRKFALKSISNLISSFWQLFNKRHLSYKRMKTIIFLSFVPLLVQWRPNYGGSKFPQCQKESTFSPHLSPTFLHPPIVPAPLTWYNLIWSKRMAKRFCLDFLNSHLEKYRFIWKL